MAVAYVTLRNAGYLGGWGGSPRPPRMDENELLVLALCFAVVLVLAIIVGGLVAAAS